MKYILRFVLLFAVLFACKPMRQLPDVQASNLPVKNPALLTASADTLPKSRPSSKRYGWCAN
ncbi:MAG: hypothetical protein MUD08_18380 [Cytophagales bacterium]|nr:hypothetical protein [Cytophagales bacterium]